MSEVGVEIVKTEEVKESEIKYLNINVSNSEVERNPDIVRLCSDIGVIEYVKPKTGHWIKIVVKGQHKIMCNKCNYIENEYITHIRYFCPSCGVKMIEPQESEDHSLKKQLLSAGYYDKNPVFFGDERDNLTQEEIENLQ